MRTVCLRIYSYEELSAAAKAKARDWYTEGSGGHLDYDWWEGSYEYFMEICEALGVEVATHTPHNPNACARLPKIRFRGFYSQGDGASFEGTYSYKKGAVESIKVYAPKDEELRRIAQGLQDIQRQHFYKLTAKITAGSGSNFYSHSGTMRVEVWHADDEYRDIGSAEDDIKDLMRSLADWLYSRLEKDYEYLTSAESVAESIIANEYEFTEDGEAWR